MCGSEGQVSETISNILFDHEGWQKQKTNKSNKLTTMFFVGNFGKLLNFASKPMRPNKWSPRADFECDVGYVLADATAPGVTKKDAAETLKTSENHGKPLANAWCKCRARDSSPYLAFHRCRHRTSSNIELWISRTAASPSASSSIALPLGLQAPPRRMWWPALQRTAERLLHHLALEFLLDSVVACICNRMRNFLNLMQ